jgi:hypothetical protein
MMETMRTGIFHRALGTTALAVGVAYGVEVLWQWGEIRPFTGKRPRLPVYPPAEAKMRLDAGEPYPRQLTSWSAVYHVLQRYGAWAGVSRFATVFDGNGAFRERR